MGVRSLFEIAVLWRLSGGSLVTSNTGAVELVKLLLLSKRPMFYAKTPSWLRNLVAF